MGYKIRISLLILVISCIYAHAASSVSSDVVGNQADHKIENASELAEVIGRNNQICTLCEEFTAETLYYLSQNQTQTEILNALHKGCFKLKSFSQQCILLVDYYVPLFLIEISTIDPELFCTKVDLCDNVILAHLPKREDTCTLCHRFVSEILAKLQDPDTQLNIIEILLKGCNKVENYVQECKKLVLEYGPLILINAESFLETTDVCAMLRACKGVPEEAVAAA